MEKTKLKEIRNAKRIPQERIAEYLNMSATCYSRRENGQTYIKNEEWLKLAKILDVPLSEIYEPDEKQSNTFKDNISSNIIGTNFGSPSIYTVPESLLETQQKYIAKLEAEIEELKKRLN